MGEIYIKEKVMDFIYKKLIYFLLCMICISALSSEQNYYEILSVSPTASQEEITQAYNRLMSHPGHKDEHRATMIEIQEAYIILKDGPLRRIYDKKLQSQSSNTGNFSDMQMIRNQQIEKSEEEFMRAYQYAVGESSPPDRVFNLYKIATMGFKLSYRQVVSILELVIQVRAEPSFVRRAALTVIARYVDQLSIENINLLLFLGSSKNKLEDRHLNKKEGEDNINEEELVSQRDIKEMARDIADQWLKIQFEHSDRIDQLIEVVVNTDNKYSFFGYKYFRRFVLKALKDRYTEKLTPEHIRLLRNFSRQEVQYFFKIRSIVKKWNQINNACSKQMKEIGFMTR